jgi:hypothetical protein
LDGASKVDVSMEEASTRAFEESGEYVGGMGSLSGSLRPLDESESGDDTKY